MSIYPIDFFILCLLLLGSFWGLRSGVIGMLFAFMALMAGVFVAFQLAPQLSPYLFAEDKQYTGNIVLGIVGFILGYFVVRKLGRACESLIGLLELKWLDTLLGGSMGLAQTALITGALVLFLKTGPLQFFTPWLQDAPLALYLGELTSSSYTAWIHLTHTPVPSQPETWVQQIF